MVAMKSMMTLAMLSLSSHTATATAKLTKPLDMEKLNLNENEFNANSKAAKSLFAASSPSNPLMPSRSVEDANYFLPNYSIKFLGCHDVSQWNGDYKYEENDGQDDSNRILQRRLVSYRLCPTKSCTHNSDSGCNSKYGDYIVDINTFVYYYLAAQAEQNEYFCALYEEECTAECGENSKCLSYCYGNNGAICSDGDDDGYYDLDPSDYAMCAEFGGFGNGALYLGPYCPSSNDAIYLGLFTDDTCSTFSNCGANCFSSKTGYNLPYSSTSLIPGHCISCDGNYDTCVDLYDESGKCETKMYVDYPNESACTYVEGIRYMGSNGVIHSQTVKKSRTAAVFNGGLTVAAVLLGGYIYFLTTKLKKAKNSLVGNSSSGVYA